MDIGFLTPHAAFFILGAVLAWATFYALGRRWQFATDYLEWLVLAVFVAGVLAARLGFIVAYPNLFLDGQSWWRWWEGGLVSYAGILAGAGVVFAWLQTRPKDQRLTWSGIALAATLWGWGLGRIGNYLQGESGGVTSGFWQFAGGSVPIQLGETLLCWTLAAWLSWRLWRRQVVSTATLLAVSGGYFLGRFMLDAWRDETRYLSLGISQWAGLAALAVLAVAWLYAKKRA